MISSEYTSRVFSEQWAAPLCYIRLQIVLRRPITIGSVLDLSFYPCRPYYFGFDEICAFTITQH